MMFIGLAKQSLLGSTLKSSVSRSFHSSIRSLAAPQSSQAFTNKTKKSSVSSKHRKAKNLSSKMQKEKSREKVDPVLGKPNNSFIARINEEVYEPNFLKNRYNLNDVEKLLYGAFENRKLKSESTFGVDEDRVAQITAEENLKKESILRILNIKNSSNLDKKKIKTELARREFERFEGDTGSSEVQAAIMTVKIHALMEHVKLHPQDSVHIRKTRMLVQKRQRVLKYLKADQPKRYFWCIEKLGLTDDVVSSEFNMDKKYMEEFEIWPGRKLHKVTKTEREAIKNAAKIEKLVQNQARKEAQN